jgi:hypothetical protein
MDEDATYCGGGENNGATGGASYIRYEIIEKKGRQMVVPVRYSIRKRRGGANIEGQEMHLERQIINNEVEIEYKPN